MRQKIPQYIPLNHKNYLELLTQSLVSQKDYLTMSSNLNNFSLFIFFITNILLSSLIRFWLKIIEDRSVSLVFLSISQSLFLLPFAFFWLIIASIVLHIISKILLGKGGLFASLKAIILSTPPLIFLSIPYLSILSILLFTYLLILNFKNLHNYGFIKAIINIMLPGILVVLFLIITGIIYSLVPSLKLIVKI